LHRLANLNVYQAKHGRAPHKPLLLLVILEMADRRELPAETLVLAPELSYAFDTFWTVVKHRRTQPPDVRMPFHHLTTNRVWRARTADDRKSPHRSVTTHVKFDPGFAECLEDAEFRERARRILIAIDLFDHLPRKARVFVTFVVQNAQRTRQPSLVPLQVREYLRRPLKTRVHEQQDGDRLLGEFWLGANRGSQTGAAVLTVV
jgi:hypothetical protein